jgi:hypothetical protein
MVVEPKIEATTLPVCNKAQILLLVSNILFFSAHKLAGLQPNNDDALRICTFSAPCRNPTIVPTWLLQTMHLFINNARIECAVLLYSLLFARITLQVASLKWLQFYFEEQKGTLDYHGYIKPCRNSEA